MPSGIGLANVPAEAKIAVRFPAEAKLPAHPPSYLTVTSTDIIYSNWYCE
jgi:hypothetical protein